MADQMDSRAKEVLKIGNKMFSDKREVDSLWQELAYNFYPARANFTTERSWGEEYNDHLFSSYPILSHRELSNHIGANMRPRDRRWLSMHVNNEQMDDEDSVRRYLEYLEDIQWRAMYDPDALLTKATKQADADYAAFGNGVIHVTTNINGDTLLYKNYHLRDCVWSENAEGKIDVLYRKWKPSARQLKWTFGDKVSKEVHKACEKDPEKKFDCLHALMPSRLYDYKKRNGDDWSFTSLFVECDSETMLGESGKNFFNYVVPRWMTVSGSPFGRSMATEIALPDSRTMQVVMRTLREAGEKFVDPPMIAVMEAIRGDIPLYAGGITVADAEYDEKTGEVLRPISQDRGGFPIGYEIATALREDIRHAFFIDKLQLPELSREMTATEVRRRIEEHIRSQAPIFEPIEQEYNMPLCEVTFNTLLEGGAFPIQDMPQELANQDIEFKFSSPMSELEEQNEAGVFMEGVQLVGQVAQVDPAQLENIRLTTGTRDALKALGFKQEWLNDEEAVDARRKQLMKEAEEAKAMAALGQAGAVAEQGGKGLKEINEAVQ